MTSKLTREENVQAVFDLKAGYILGLADVEILKRVARMALGVMDSEPVAVVEPSDYVTAAQLVGEGPARKAVHELYEGALRIGDKLYRHAQQPVVPEKATVGEMPFLGRSEGAYVRGWNACRAAMLQAGNSPLIPDGYVMVPKEPTAEMVIKMRYHVGGYDRNIKEGYKVMLAAAPQPQNAPQNIPEIIPGWIPVSDRMPERGVGVLACNVSPVGGCEEIETAQWHGGMRGNQPVFITGADTIDPEYWMPLPAAPQEGKS